MRSSSPRARQLLGLVGALLVAALVWWSQDAGSPGNPGGPSVAPSAHVLEDRGSTERLPPEVVRTIALIEAGGPFPYRQDGTTFGNRERLLPVRPVGYYREFTVPTPGSRDRGARRIVLGDSGELYYTADHYRSFTRIDPTTRE